MSTRRAIGRPLVQCLRQAAAAPVASRYHLSTTSRRRTDATASTNLPSEEAPSPFDLDPNTVLGSWAEAHLAQLGTPPVGSRRRRAAMRTSAGLPFEQLPYQCFQEARKVLAADREEKLAAITAAATKLRDLEAAGPEAAEGRAAQSHRNKVQGLRRRIERLKILADINDPAVKRRFEDGIGDMDKPIYRYLADRRWRAYDHKLITQRIAQFHIVPDLLPKLDPAADVQLHFGRRKFPPGAVVASAVSERPPRLRVQVFDRGERLVSVAVVDPDVPDPATDAFRKRCHFLAANIPLAPGQPSIPLGRVRAEDQLAVPWLPPASQKGAPPHRLAVFVLRQAAPLDAAALRGLYARRDGFELKSFRDKFRLSPLGFTMFRAAWDENTAEVMGRAGLPGADVEFRRRRVRSLKEPRKPRGWEAKRQGPKFRHLWKYTKRIRGLSNARGWIKKE